MINTLVSVLLLVSLVSGYLSQRVFEGERTAGYTFADEDETSDEDVHEQATKLDRDGVDGFNPSVESAPGETSASAESRWNETRKVADTTEFEKLVLGMSVEEAAEVVKSSYEHSQLLPTTTTSGSRQSPPQHIASDTVRLRTKEVSARQFVECVNIGSGAGVEAERAKSLGGGLADLTRTIDNCAGSIGVGITGVSVASGASPGLGMSISAIFPSAYLYLYELSAILEESESECSSEAEEDGVSGVGVRREEDMYNNSGNSNHKYNRNTGVLPAIITTTTIPIPAPLCPKPPAAMLFALRRALGSMAFNLTSDMEDTRDRIVHVLAHMGRVQGGWGFAGLKVVLTRSNTRLAVKCTLIVHDGWNLLGQYTWQAAYRRNNKDGTIRMEQKENA
ncbi:hypothetical protein BU17DRAFT_70638 [Hysterangium stoloniferum]|nr:hypothetical protein BU17DRAFT_70638 [Hysterangium stoloniferum]